MSSRAEERALKKKEELQRRREKRKEEREREQMELRQAFNEDGTMSRNFIESLLSTDDITRGGPEVAAGQLHESTISKLQNMLSRDWVLANMSQAQEHDIRYKLDVLRFKIIGIHPPEESVITGPTRAFLFNDASEEMEPLSQQQRLLVDEFIESLKGRLTRGREGFERQQMNTSIAETRSAREEDDESSDTFAGFFS